MKEKILIVDDEPDILDQIDHLLSEEGYQVKKAGNGKEAIEMFRSESFALVITDLKMPKMGGLEVLEQVKQRDEYAEVIVLTGYASIETAISTLRDCRAYDYLRKPLENIDDLIISVNQALEHRRLCLENKKLVMGLENANAGLEDRVEKRTLDLKQTNAQLILAREKAEGANIAKTNFLSSMSHELRTPLNAIIGFSEVLKDEHFGPLTPKQKSYVKDILTSGKHLNSLIEDILNLTQIEKKTDALKLKPLDMVCFLENLFPLIREKTQKHFILPDLNISRKVAGLFVRADEQRLKQVMMDLVDNAVKFTPKRGKISIAAELILDSEDTICGKGAGENVSRKGAKAQSKINEFQSAGDNIQSSTNNIQSSIVNLQYIRVSVTDSGIGIAPGDQEKIFEDFFQIKGGLTDKTAGTGLGLSLVRRIIEMHGGRIWAKSFGEGKGSRFFFVIPVLEDIRKKEPKGANK